MTTLLNIVQQILSDMNSDEINSISDTSEGMQVATIVRDTYDAIVIERNLPEHNQLIRLIPSSDSEFPTRLTLPANVRNITQVSYDISRDQSGEYRILCELKPQVFLNRARPGLGRDVMTFDRTGSTRFYVGNDRPPSNFTVFADRDIVFDSFDKTVGATILASNTRAFGQILPEFLLEDSYEPEMDRSLIPLLVAEAKSAAFAVLLDKPHVTAERNARRYRSYLTRDEHKTGEKPFWRNYGRR